MLNSAKIIEKNTVPSEAFLVHGMPDVGLVGVIAASHLITEYKMVEMAYIDSESLPPVAVLHEGLPYAPIRVFGNDGLLITITQS